MGEFDDGEGEDRQEKREFTTLELITALERAEMALASRKEELENLKDAHNEAAAMMRNGVDHMTKAQIIRDELFHKLGNAMGLSGKVANDAQRQ